MIQNIKITTFLLEKRFSARFSSFWARFSRKTVQNDENRAENTIFVQNGEKKVQKRVKTGHFDPFFDPFLTPFFRPFGGGFRTIFRGTPKSPKNRV